MSSSIAIIIAMSSSIVISIGTDKIIVILTNSIVPTSVTYQRYDAIYCS